MDPVAIHVTHRALLVMRECDNCSLLIGLTVIFKASQGGKKNSLLCFMLIVYLAIWGYFSRHKSGGSLSGHTSGEG